MTSQFKGVFVAAVSLVVALGAAVALVSLNTNATSSYRDCAADAIITCGALTQSELLSYYNSNKQDVRSIYSHYGISKADLQGNLVMGTVNRAGEIRVNGKVVARNAKSVSRVRYADLNGNQPKTIRINGVELYEGPNMSIFLQNSYDVFVIMKDGQFQAGVMTSCANPIIGKPEKPEPKPVYSCDALTVDKIDRTKFKFTAKASASNGAKVELYIFELGDGKKVSQSSPTLEHTYAKAGTYNAKLSVNVKVNGKTETVTSANCTAKVVVLEENKIEVCDLTTKKVIQIKESEFDEKTMSKNLEDCKEKPAPEKIKVCVIESKTIEEINKEDFDDKTMTTDLAKCEATVPPKLPETGLDLVFSGTLGIGSIVASGSYWVNSRKELLKAFLNRK